MKAARAAECKVVTFSGFEAENPLRRLGDINFYIASDSIWFRGDRPPNALSRSSGLYLWSARRLQPSRNAHCHLALWRKRHHFRPIFIRPANMLAVGNEREKSPSCIICIPMRTLVTGGAGFIGSHLCDRLLERGDEVWCLDNLRLGRRRNIAHLEASAGFRFIDSGSAGHDHLDGAVCGCAIRFGVPYGREFRYCRRHREY